MPSTPSPAPPSVPPTIDSLFFSAAHIATFEHERGLTNASGFFFERDGRLWLVTSRHVLIDEPTKHFPNRIEIKLHTSRTDLTRSSTMSMLTYRDGKAMWRQGKDSGGEIDVAMLEIDRAALPKAAVLNAFTPDHLLTRAGAGRGGQLGADPGFSARLSRHRLQPAGGAAKRDRVGLRHPLSGQGILSDRCAHPPRHQRRAGGDARPGSRGAGALPWKLLGVHSASLDMANREQGQDETLGLNCAWYADILMTLSEP